MMQNTVIYCLMKLIKIDKLVLFRGDSRTT